MRKKLIPFMVLGALLVSCGKDIPEDIIQPAEMEDLLYDYHISVSMGADLPNVTNVERDALKNYALKKHNVSRALFDSSMVWYTRHADFLYEIYSKLDKRYTMAETRMKTQINKRSGQIEISLSGDSVDVWSDRDIYWLSTSSLTNKVTFNLKADTTFRPLDALALEADFTFFNDGLSSAAHAVVGLNIGLRNDSTYAVVETVNQTGHKQLHLKAGSASAFNEVTGFIYCTAPDSVRGNVLVSGIRLMRYHNQGEGQQVEENSAARTSEKGSDELKAQPQRFEMTR